jgi:hypothetical protein
MLRWSPNRKIYFVQRTYLKTYVLTVPSAQNYKHPHCTLLTSFSHLVAVLRIRDIYPGSWFLPIPDPGSKNRKKEGQKKIWYHIFFVVANLTKLNIILFLKCWRKKFGPIFRELLKFLPKNFSLCSQIYGFGIRDPGSEIRDPEKTYSGSRIQGSKRPGSRIRILNTV